MGELKLKSQPTLRDYQDYMAELVKERGFEDYSLAQSFMQLVEEIGEFARAARKESGLKQSENTPDNASGREAADAFMIFLDICNKLSINLEQSFREKEEENKNRKWT